MVPKKNMEPDLDLICLTLRWYSCNFFFEKADLKKSADEKKNHEKLSRVQGVNHLLHKKSFDPFEI